MAQVLLTFAGASFVVLGALHGLLTLRDVTNPRAFTPTDAAVRHAMEGARLALNPRANIWQAWLGFNLSHSLGTVLFGSGLLFLAWHHLATFKASHLVQVVALVIAAAYVVISYRFWFWGPALGSGFAFVCILGALWL